MYGLGEEAVEKLSFLDKLKAAGNRFVDSALETYTTKAANQFAKSMSVPTPQEKAAAVVAARETAIVVAQKDSGYGKTALLIGVPTVGLGIALALWKMGRKKK